MIQYVAAALWNIVSQSILILLLSKCLVLDKDMCVPRSTGVYKKICLGVHRSPPHDLQHNHGRDAFHLYGRATSTLKNLRLRWTTDTVAGLHLWVHA